MVEKKKVDKNLFLMSLNLKTWNKEKQIEENSSLVDSVYINKINSDGNEFYDITIHTKDNSSHKATLRFPKSDLDKELDKKTRTMSDDEKKALLKELD